MDLSPSPDTTAYRDRIAGFLDAHLPHGWAGLGALDADRRAEFLPWWRELLLENGYLGLTWPVEYGGAGLGPLELQIVQEEFARAGAPLMPLPNDPFNFILLGPTLIACGTPEQQERFLPKLLSGEYRFAQGFSEPEAGSDLFALRTRGVLTDGEWVVNGQKIWQTAGDTANWLFVLTRTEPDAAKSKGLSLLLIPVDQAGVLVRPIRTITGESEFCEVFLDDARTAADNLVGGRGDGVSVTMTMLGFEREAGAGGVHLEHRHELERLADLAVSLGRADDPLVRQRLGWAYAKVETMRLLQLRSLTAVLDGESSVPMSSLMKLSVSEYEGALSELAMDLLGLDGLQRSGLPGTTRLGPDPHGGPNSANAWQHVFLTARAATIYAGSSQIQRNTLAERVLGLPREPKTPATTGGRR